MNDRVLAILVFLLGYRVEVFGGHMMLNGDLTAIWMVAVGVMFTFLSFAIVNEATQ
ncbi:protein of unknown function [Pseudotevenvirus RB43]|uniref:Uncharacterized protein n=2 Tax=Pseudotevenvirus RB43 TaxID=115991 RepID=Q56BF4_9CAUD|nr:hypothetical protein RB43ORF245w [Escherichia phage RB43]AAX78767.1 hypothetical protein RB43ORF245w [Escherichia phage RB43]QJI10959.1 hypothetical protein GuL6_239 [Buttiauxella phage vB_ButM_GuL6]CCK74088.1 protein of unknown function [Pseudotevenvirus RB43]CCL97705.1 protein of unknown function [Pseudotevenvirus RB43]